MKNITLGTVTIITTKTQWLRLKITTGGVYLNGYVYHSQNGEPATTLTATDRFGYQTPNTNLTKTCLKGWLTGTELAGWIGGISELLPKYEHGCGVRIPAEVIHRTRGPRCDRRAVYRLTDTQALELCRTLVNAQTAIEIADNTSNDREQRLVWHAQRVERQRLNMNEYNRRNR